MANTVYTESVVTLNSTQAEATMNALKSSADELRRKMVEATKLGNADDAKKYQRELDAVKKSMSGIQKQTKDYSDLMKNLNGSTLNELSKAYKGLQAQIKNLVPGTQEFIEKSKQLKQVKSRMDEVNGSVKGTNKTLNALKGLLPKLGLASVFAAAAKAVVQFAKDAVKQTQQVGDRWAQFTHGMTNAYNTFVAQLSSGKGWNNLIANMRESYRVGKEVEAMLDEIFERENSLAIEESQLNVEIEKNKQLMRDVTKSNEERLAAARAVDAAESELAGKRKSIAAQEAEARKKELVDRTELSDTELEMYVVGYENNRKLIQQAQEYSAAVTEAEKGLQKLYAGDATTESINRAQSELAALRNSADENVRAMAEIDAKYQLSNDELVKAYVQARVKMNNADAEYYRSTARSNTMAASLQKELSQEFLQNAENAYKEEIAAVDRHQKEMELSALSAYSSGEINEQQYQNRLISIQETAYRSKIAISERYQKETVEFQTQLLKLTVQQEAELRAILQQSEADAAKILEDLMADDSVKAVMEEVDAGLEAEVEHLVDLSRQADDIRTALDPKGAMGAMLESELANLDEMHEQKLLSEEEYEQAKQDMIRSYAKANLQMDMERWSAATDSVMAYVNEAGNAVSALRDAESARLEAQMEAELTAAGDNAEERERIEAEYEKKKLDTEKKYAVADMVINIAKTVAAGALAIMQAFAQLGPVAAGVMAALIGTTTAAQVATIVAQKDAIMNTSINSGSGAGSTSSSSLSARIPTGYSSGGYTSAAANDYQEVGIVHANEWVAPASMVRANPIVFRRLERARRQGTAVSGVAGFADGGMTTPVSQAVPAVQGIDPALLRQLTAVLQYIVDNGIPAYILLSDLNRQIELQQTFNSISGKK